MKVLKGLFAYSLILIVGFAVIAGLLFGAMFLFPGFTLFDWCVIKEAKIRDQVDLSLGSRALNDVENLNIKVLNVNVDVGGYPVEITTFDDANYNYVRVIAVRDYIGLVKKQTNQLTGEKSTPNLVVETTFSGSACGKDFTNVVKDNVPENATITDVNIHADAVESPMIFYNSSLIKVVLPSSGVRMDGKPVYINLNVKTTSGDVKTEGTTAKQASIQGAPVEKNVINFRNVDIHTTSGNVTLKHFNRETYRNEAGKWFYDSDVVLDNLKLKTESGKYILFNHSEMKTQADIDALKKNGVTNDEALKLPELKINSTFEINSNKGDFVFRNVSGKELSIYGDNVKITANKLNLENKFVFTATNGIVEFGEIECKASEEQQSIQIITKNTNINIGELKSPAFIETTYGDINIKSVNGNAKLTSTHGNINIGKASGTLLAASTHGDINCVKSGYMDGKKEIGGYYGKAMFTNKNGKINVEFNDAKLAAEYNVDNAKNVINNDFTTTIINEKGPTVVKNLVGRANITATGNGSIEVYFSDLADVTTLHYIHSNGGTSKVFLPTTTTGTYGNSVVFAAVATNKNVKGEINGTKVAQSAKKGENYVPTFYPNIDAANLGDDNKNKVLNGEISILDAGVNIPVVWVDGKAEFNGVIVEVK